MLNLKNFVSRRRPSENPDLATASSPLLQMPPEEDTRQAGLLDASEEELLHSLAEELPDTAGTGDELVHDLTEVDLRHMESARAGRDHVPAPDALQHDPCRPTLGGRMAPTTRPVSTPRAPSRQTLPAGSALPKIWDLEAPQTAIPSLSETPPGVRPDATHMTAEPRPPAPAREPAPERTPASEPALSPVFETRSGAAAETAPPPARPKTRLLGFHGTDTQEDLFSGQPAARPTVAPRFPIGWIVVLEGPGRGASFTLVAGLSTIGRDPGQTVSLDFGDTAISREGHVSIAYDAEDNRAYIGHGGKANIVRLNDKPLLTTEELQHGDTIRIGETSLRFVAFCTEAFSWRQAPETDGADG